MTATFVDSGVQIECDPEWHGGWPYVAGTRKTVAGVAMLYNDGMPAEEIATEKYMTLPQVFAALAYYLVHKDEVDRQVDEAGERYDRLAAAAALLEQSTRTG